MTPNTLPMVPFILSIVPLLKYVPNPSNRFPSVTLFAVMKDGLKLRLIIQINFLKSSKMKNKKYLVVGF